MRYVQGNILCLEDKDAVEAGLSIDAIRKAKQRNSPSWTFHEHPEDKRKILFEYDKLKQSDKDKVIARFGNPFEYVAKMPIKNMVKWDDKAEEFFLAYTYDDDKKLSIEHVKKYTLAASWLNMFKTVSEDKKTIKKLLNLTIEQFYAHAIQIIIADKVDLPTTYIRLISHADSALKKYIRDGYASIIDWRFGNKLAAKVKDELSESTLLEMIAHPNQYDDVFIAQQYNKWAKANGYKAIDETTVGVWRRKKQSEIIMQREGNAALKNTFLRQAKGRRPSAPLYLVESDDNHLDLAFIDPENPKSTPRYIAIVVTDSFNDYPLGYAYALAGTLNEGQSISLVKAAYVNAMYYIRSITGEWYLPHETKTDNWAIKQLRPFYESLGKYIKTEVGSKNRGYIENFFGSEHWQRCLKIGANNYTGHNITAKSRGVNVEYLARTKQDRPLIGSEAEAQIDSFFHRLRHIPQKNGMSKHQQWLEAWQSLPIEKKRPITDEQFLLKFGIEHNHNGDGLRITNRGVQPQITINGQSTRFNYDLQNYRLEDINKRVSVYYDPFDMSRVLVTDHKNLRMMAYTAQINSRALEDSSTDSRTYLNSILNEKQFQVEYLAEKSEKRKKVLVEAGYTAETLLKEGVMLKEVKQAAEQKAIAQIINQDYTQDDFFNQI